MHLAFPDELYIDTSNSDSQISSSHNQNVGGGGSEVCGRR